MFVYETTLINTRKNVVFDKYFDFRK